MSAGDAIVYSGTELEHWREELDKGYVNMCFIHYCKKGSEYKLDSERIYRTAKINRVKYVWESRNVSWRPRFAS